MRNRAVWFFVGAILVSVLALASTGIALAAMHGAFGTAERPAAQEAAGVGVTHVFMRNDQYFPSRIQVVTGTTVTWTNQDNVPHSVILTPVVISSTADIWESGLLSPGQSFSYTFTVRGTFKYYCSEHPNEMIGIVTVT